METFHLECSVCDVDLRVREFNARWIASADTPDGPSLGCGRSAFEAIWQALAPYDGVVGELLAALPDQMGR
jgi:hypothetical protein